MASKESIRLSKAPYVVLENDQALSDLVRSIEGLFDLNKIVNPGKNSRRDLN